jgi:hypothetical protein
MRWRPLAVLLVILAGCASKKAEAPRQKQQAKMKVAEGAPVKEAPAPKDEAKALPRKLIYTAAVELIVDDLDQATAQLRRALDEQGGYIAKMESQGTPGIPRQGTWTVRVPAGKLDDFLKAVEGLGEVRRKQSDVEDVSDRYYDLRAEMRNEEAREEALRALYKKLVPSASKAEDLLALDREIAAVRSKINVAKGRLQRWDKDVEYSTVTVVMRDRKDYVPPIMPRFGSRVGRTFTGSIEALVAVGEFLVHAVVALAPWLVVLAVIGGPAAIIARRRRWRRPPGPPPAGTSQS